MRPSAPLPLCALLLVSACGDKDGGDGDDTSSASAAPEVRIDAPGEGADLSDLDPLVFEATVSDDVDAPDTLVLAWTDAGGAVLDVSRADTDGIARFTIESPEPGGHAVTLSATDLDGGVGTATVSFTVGGAPSAPGVAIEPETPRSIDALEAVIAEDAVDPEGDPLTYRYVWTVDGEDAELSDADIPAEETARGEVWAVEVYANDGSFEGLPGSAEVVIGNTPPSIADVGLAPTEAFEGDTLSCAPGTTSDADGDAVTLSHEWTVDGVAVAETSSSLGSGAFDKGEVVSCVVTPNDGIEPGRAVASNPVRISNSPPVVDGASLSPDPATTTTALTCTRGTVSDADGDPVGVSHAWTVDGTSVSETSTILQASAFSRGQEVVCIVTASDDEESGEPATASVTISNTAPTAPSISITPRGPGEGVDDLLCSIVTDGTDADGDALTYTFSWSVDGTSHTGTTSTTTHTGDTLPASETIAGETWSCTVDTDDGTDSGTPVTSTGVVIEASDVTYDITLSDLFNQGNSCSTVTNQAVYNDGCSGDWGMSWTDTGSTTPTAVQVELYHGLYCSSSTSKSTDLNGTASGTFTMSGGNCACNPSEAVLTWDLSDVSGYVPGGTNTFTIGNDGSCEGLSVNSAWGSGVYARVTVSY